jgi:hypothetical protein
MRGVLVRGRRETGDVSCEDGYWKGSWGTSTPVSIAFPIEGYFFDQCCDLWSVFHVLGRLGLRDEEVQMI